MMVLLFEVLAALAAVLWLASWAAPADRAQGLGLLAWATMIATYLPTLHYYGLSPLWALLMPLAGALYLGMTWSSALRYWRGVRSRWKGRVYR